jgi:EAL domain-containing protein (putative c-di-GMP-specific phosphodiesterase class I)
MKSSATFNPKSILIGIVDTEIVARKASLEFAEGGVALTTRTVNDLAHNLKMLVITEGVGSEAQLAFLRYNNWDELQESYYSKPFPTDICTALKKERPQLSLEVDRPE